MYASVPRDGSHTLTNSGTITVSGNGDVYGMYAFADGDGNHSLTNSGTIAVSGTGNTVFGMHAYVRNSGNHTLSNSGTITVSGNDDVYGMLVGGTGTHNLSNTGYISASATGGEAYEAYGADSYNVNTWATTLRTWSANDAVFGANNGETVNLANSTLVFRPQVTAGVVEFGVTYNLSNLVIIDGTATDTPLGKIEAEVPFLKAVVTGGTTTATASVRLEKNVSEETTPGSANVQQAVAQVQGQFNNISTSLRNTLIGSYTQAYLVADAGTIVTVDSSSLYNKWQIFLNPHAGYVNNSKLDYDGSNMGISFGGSYRLSELFSFGAHVDLSVGDYDGELMDMSTYSNSYALGVHAAYNFTPALYLRGQLTGSINENDSKFKTLTSSADSKSNGKSLYAALATGYTLQFAKNHSISPEVGISYLGAHTSDYSINFGSALNLNYDDSYYNALYATANVDWRGEWNLVNNSTIAGMASLGLRQAITNGEMETKVKTLGTSYTVISTEDTTTFLVNAGVEYSKNSYSVSLSYDGGFGSDQTAHAGNLMIKYNF